MGTMTIHRIKEYSDALHVEVLEQMERVLAHPLFSQSKRYPAFFRYVVEQTLHGNADQLKERTIGMAIFGRSADYDLSLDPVVRITAAEVRKRLAQYYYTARTEELRIEIIAGSYIPHFHRKSVDSVDDFFPVTRAEEPLPESIETTATEAMDNAAQRALSRKAWLHKRIVYAFALLITLLCSVGLYLQIYPQAISRNQLEDQFWAPMLASPAAVTFCIAEADLLGRKKAEVSDRDTGSASHHFETVAEIPLAVTVSLSRVLPIFDRHYKPYKIYVPSQISFDQLQEGPIVIVGWLNNSWEDRLTQDLRFVLVRSLDGKTISIIDRKSSSSRSWSLDMDQPFRDLTKSYAIIARFHEKTTGQFIVVIAGLGPEGDEAASEFFSHPEMLPGLLQNAPKNWSKMNFEAVIETQIVTGRPGPPKTIDTEYW
jgi:hypothetical protein